MSKRVPPVEKLLRLAAMSCLVFAHASAARCQETSSRISPILRQCNYNDELPLDERMHLDASVPAALGSTARKVVSALLDNDVKSFRACCSKDGIVVVERSWDPHYRSSAGTLDLKQPHGDGMWPLDWVEQEEDIDPSELAGGEVRRILKQFHVLMMDTYGGFDVSTNERDAWDKRFLGPAISAKYCAGTYMYFYLVKERSEWKIWRMEVASH